MTRILLISILLLAATAAVSSCEVTLNPFSAIKATTRETKALALADPADLDLSIENINGQIEIRGESGRSSVSLQIEKIAYGSTKEQAQARLKKIKVLTDRQGDQISLHVQIPWGIWGNAPRVNFTLLVPATLKRAGARSVNGRLSATGLSASEAIELTTVNGSVSLTGRSSLAELRSTNGRIEVQFQGEAHLSAENGSIGGALTAGPIDVSTTNGSIELSLIQPRGGQIQAQNGRIQVQLIQTTDLKISATSSTGNVEMIGFPAGAVERANRSRGAQAHALLGAGDRTLKLRTQNGSISVELDHAAQQ